MNKDEKAKVAAVRARILSDTRFARDVFRCIYLRQKPEERFTGRHMGHDGRGFRAAETVYLNALYEELVSQEWRITPEQADEVRERMAPYAGQWITASRERHDPGGLPNTGFRTETSRSDKRNATREEAEARGVGFTDRYDAARRGEERPPRASMTDDDRRRISDMLEKWAG